MNGEQDQITGLVLNFSVREYLCPLWDHSKHTKHVYTVLNETCRLITVCLRPTSIKSIYLLAGITPPEIRRFETSLEKKKQAIDHRYPVNGYTETQTRLEAKKIFMKVTKETQDTSQLELLQKNCKPRRLSPSDHIMGTYNGNIENIKQIESRGSRTKANIVR